MSDRSYLYVGSYTHRSSTGIHVYDASDPDGLLVEQSTVEGVEHPSYLATHPNGRMLYAVSETTSPDGGGLVAFRIDPADGSLTLIDRASSRGAAPCHLSVDGAGQHLYVANYQSGSVAVYALGDDGRFGGLIATRQHAGSGPSPRQESPHPHCIVPNATNDSVCVADLGTDRIVRYRHDRHRQDGAFEHDGPFESLDELVLEPGSGPRHLVFHPALALAFVVCELDSTVVSLGVDPTTGRLDPIARCSTLPDDFVGSSIAAEIRVHPDGRRVYVSNRGHDSIAVFGLVGTDGQLELLGRVPSGGRTPRSFAIHPFGRSLLVANQDSNSIVPFAIDASTGMPEQRTEAHGVSEPVCLTFLAVER